VTLAAELRDAITAEGPIPFEQFQAQALYHPVFGFFSGTQLRSTKAGDFLTSPEVSPLFGETLAGFVRTEQASVVGQELVIVDAGAGSGSLLRPLLAGLDAPLEAWAVEASPAARAALEGVVPGRVVAEWHDLPQPFAGVIIANELLDNLPVSLARKTQAGWEEQWVGLNGDRLVLVPVSPRHEVAAWADQFGDGTPVGGLVEVQLAARQWIEQALASLRNGALVVIDYGDTVEGLAPRRSQGTLRTYRSHHLGPDPLLEPGSTDITVDVNFTAAEAAAKSAGAESVIVERQDRFLAAWGLRDRLSELRNRELELARDGDPMERLKVRSVKTEAETLLHPRGLGDFRVLVARK